MLFGVPQGSVIGRILFLLDVADLLQLVKVLEFFSEEVGQGTIAEILSLMGLGGPRIAHSKNWSRPLRFLGNLRKTFLEVGCPGGPGAKI